MTTKQIWNQYEQDVRYFIFSKVKNIAVTDDLVQETFLKIHTKLNTIKNVSKIRSWVFSISRNIVIDYYRANNKVLELSNMESYDPFQDIGHSKEDCLPAHINNLNKIYREPLILSDIEGIKQKEIAQLLSLPLSTVKSRIQRGRKKISISYMDCCGYVLNAKGELVGEDMSKEDCNICR